MALLILERPVVQNYMQEWLEGQWPHYFRLWSPSLWRRAVWCPIHHRHNKALHYRDILSFYGQAAIL